MKKGNRILLSIVLMAITSIALMAAADIPPMLTFATIFSIGVGIGIAKHFIGATNMEGTLLYTGITLTDQTYAGEVAGNLIVRAMTSNAMVQGGHIYLKDGIKKQFTIPRWDITFEDFVQDVKATPTPGPETETVDGQQLITSEYMIYHEFNPRDYEDHWYSQQLGGSVLVDTTLPQNVETTIVTEVLKRNGWFVNKLIWNGDKTSTTKMKYINGLKKKANLSSKTIKVTSPLTLSAGNVQAQFQRGYDLIPVALKYASYAENDGTVNSKLKIFCSPYTFDLFCQAQIAQTNKGVDFTQVGINKFRGIKVVPIPDFPNDYYQIAVGAPDMSSNIWMGMNSTDDESTIQLKQLQANSELWFIKGLAKIDVQYGWNEEVVSYE